MPARIVDSLLKQFALTSQLGANGAYDAMYAVVLTVAFLGFAADRGYQMFTNRMLQWREQAH